MSAGTAAYRAKSDIAYTLGRLNRMYLSEIPHELLGGSNISITDAGEGSFVTNTLLYRILDNGYVSEGTAAQNQYFVSGQLTNANFSTLNVATCTATPAVNYTHTTLSDLTTGLDSSYTDINIMPLVSNEDTKKFLNTLYMWHDLLDGENWSEFKSDNADVPVKIAELEDSSSPQTYKRKSINVRYSTWGDTPNTYILSSLIGKETIGDMIHSDSFVPFVLRKMIYLYIRMVSMHIMIGMYTIHTVDASRIAALNGVKALFYLMARQATRNDTDVYKKLDGGITNRTLRYKTYVQGINDLNLEYSGNTGILKRNKDRLDSENKVEKNAVYFQYIAFAIFVVVALVSSIAYLMPGERSQKLMVAGGALLVAAISGIALTFTFSKKIVEGFNNDTWYLKNRETTLNATSMTNAALEQAADYLKSFDQFLSKTFLYSAFGNTTDSMAKEYRFYYDNNKHIASTAYRYKAAYSASDLYQKRVGATMYLFVVLSMLASATVVGYIYAESLPSGQTAILYGGGIFATLAFILYVLEITSYVRTDGDKKYWGQPTSISQSL